MARTGSPWMWFDQGVADSEPLDVASRKLMRTPGDIAANMERHRVRKEPPTTDMRPRQCGRCAHRTALGTCGIERDGLKANGEPTRWTETYRVAHRCHLGLR